MFIVTEYAALILDLTLSSLQSPDLLHYPDFTIGMIKQCIYGSAS